MLANEKAESSLRPLCAALNVFSAQIAILDHGGVIIDANTAWHRFATNNGYRDPEHGIGRNYLDICRAAVDLEPSSARIAENLEATLAGRMDTFALEYLCGSHWFQMRATRFEASGSFYVVVSHEDITELLFVKQTLKQLDETQRREVAQLMRQSVVNRLSTSIAHELKQPLAAMSLYTDAAIRKLKMDPPDIDAVRKMLQGMRDLNKLAADIIDPIRGLIKRNTGKFEIISIDKLLDASLLVLHGEIVRRKIDVQSKAFLPLPQVCGDFVELQQVLINLLMNAMEAFDAIPLERNRKIVIRAETADERVSIIISDNGPGLASAPQGNLRERSVSTKTEGLGLGLSICATIAESHDGSIALENNKDGGASAILTLPVAKNLSLAQA